MNEMFGNLTIFESLFSNNFLTISLKMIRHKSWYIKEERRKDCEIILTALIYKQKAEFQP